MRRADLMGKREITVISMQMDRKKEYAEEHVFFERDFVLFTERRKNRQQIPAFLLIPPIAFPELEEKKKSFSIENIISVSPGALTDDCIRSICKFPNLPEYATILIGWNSSGGNPDE